ncbi:hypothetical protein TNIN_295911 [Trichonephila inaurata madagascariensis]|uniref:Uncharacterized protein n=1 Tax=Trichonephila inaurata madagascariensis TaxID=2747483 RepID=A0A8X7BR39_9ARAC|nr:hypothetical protein TNIN_295911 [Trichonephila inaurata madagascariensis]
MRSISYNGLKRNIFIMKEVHDKDEDIYDDLDSLSSQAISQGGDVQESLPTVSHCTDLEGNTGKDEKNLLHSAKSSPSNFILNEDNLKETEMNLYFDLLASEMKDKNNVHTNHEFIKIQEELTKLQDAIAEKDNQITNLTNENTSLKKNICSLYKTAKAEIDQKDRLLKASNKEIDRLKTYLREASVAFDYKSNSIPSSMNSVQDGSLYKNDNPDYRDRELSSYETARTEAAFMPIPSTSFQRSEYSSERNASSFNEPSREFKKQKLSHTFSQDILSKDSYSYELGKGNDFNNAQRTFSNHVGRTNFKKKNNGYEFKNQRFPYMPSRNYSDFEQANDNKWDRRKHFSNRQHAASYYNRNKF